MITSTGRRMPIERFGFGDGRHPATRRERGHLTGFTLVELMIVIVIIGILAAIVFPNFQALDQESRAKALAANTRKVREMIQIHRHSGEYAVNAAGYPTTIGIAWFRGGRLPEHAWTGRAMNIEEIADGAGNFYPLVKTFDPGNPLEQDAWYNLDNGHFCSRVPAQGSDPETIAVFNIVNASQITDLGDIN